jgi:hypothetical protein
MKYYCHNCGTELIIGDGVDTSEMFEDGLECYFDWSHGAMSRVPCYETPQDYEARTKKPWPENGLVFCKNHPKDKDWVPDTLAEARQIAEQFPEQIIVIAEPPVPPPEKWRPE